ncbi:hypothetical protein [Leptolyngbya iicbica]|uniref:Uncharacterized protein n=1 Tax=Lyngbya confervoides BDU141951 TaxID=1574623 RepID=A0A8T6QP01_9CYAN
MKRLLEKVWQKMIGIIAAEVPTAIATCEFDCRALSCNAQHWANCPYRQSK